MRAGFLALALALGASAQQIQVIEEQSSGASQSSTSATSSPVASGNGKAASGNPNAPAAPVTNDNPIGTVYKAQMPETSSNSISGYVSATGNANGTGVVWSVNIENLPKTGGPFAYHVHNEPVPADGNCTGAGPHLDPENRGEDPPCDVKQGRKTCQVGDLAGKHGKMTQSPWQVFYLDLYTSTTPGSPAFVGNRSIVIHDVNKNRLTCANLTMAAFSADPSQDNQSTGTQSDSSQTSSTQSETSTPTSSPTESSSSTQKDSQPSSSPATGAAAHLIAQPATAALGIAALFALAL